MYTCGRATLLSLSKVEEIEKTSPSFLEGKGSDVLLGSPTRQLPKHADVLRQNLGSLCAWLGLSSLLVSSGLNS